ncbi:YbaB/EbfC family nucleoid-associated protein [Micromonospora sp. PLK6-60]|uniref:YbaB/EbfC family nucleoid-associated protein n=1 Tax=Micromonospora sp. PLK6-60 TaxID=2873383 RepID=UPI001CA69EC6|nr:YbaB/EbfC family nucleoid-associated protein [Micromonospora sp. PLK6-60]MBY8875053.1 YbaB/EbfC family nucleoid-associated protein [Micromonospora sp. PLK6-60]
MSMKQSADGEFARMLEATVGALRAVSPQPEDEETARRRRTGESADGQVRAEFGSDGRLAALSLDPRLMRLGSEEVCDRVVEAVNAAIDALRGAAAPVPAAGDLSQLTEQLQEVRDTAVPRLGAFLQALTDAQTRVAGGGSR